MVSGYLLGSRGSEFDQLIIFRDTGPSSEALPDLALVLGLVSWRCLPVTRIWQLLFLHYRDNAKLK
jgi:hypothetical protein